MRKYDEQTIAALKYLGQNLDSMQNSDSVTGINKCLEKFPGYSWIALYFFSPSFLTNWGTQDSEQLTNAVNVLFSDDNIKNNLSLALNEAAQESISAKFSMRPPTDKEVKKVNFSRDDAPMVLFMLKMYAKSNQDSMFDSGCDWIYTNFLIPLYHNRNFQLCFMLLCIGSMIMLSPFAPHIALGIASAYLATLLVSMMIQASLMIIYKVLDHCTTPTSCVTTMPQSEFSNSLTGPDCLNYR